MFITKLKRKDFLYQPYYCEENIWHLCQHERFKNSYVIFIASKGNAFPMLRQRAMPDPAIPIMWDYHVVLLVLDKPNQILDFDTTLAFSTDIETYFSQSFIKAALLDEGQTPWFRLVPAAEYVERFSSDRSHMKTETGWLAPPPAWTCIGSSKNNLSCFIDMNNEEIGEVLTYEEILMRFAWSME
ncbi:hypothetical protein ACFL3P_05635 [Pseudomonadota bacterium]